MFYATVIAPLFLSDASGVGMFGLFLIPASFCYPEIVEDTHIILIICKLIENSDCNPFILKKSSEESKQNRVANLGATIRFLKESSPGRYMLT